MKRILSLLMFMTLLAGMVNAQSPKNDAAMLKISMPLYSEYTTTRLAGAFQNGGTDTLKSVIVNWTINGGPVHQQLNNDFAITKSQAWLFATGDEIVLNQTGEVLLKVWVSKPNGVDDERTSNDTLTHTIQVIEKFPPRNILIEEVTGAWCGYCPRAPIIYRSNIQPDYPNTLFVAIHTGDGMTINESKDFMNTFVTGVPTGFVDRKKTQTDPGLDFSPESWEGLLGRLDNKYTPVDLHVYNYFDPITREWKIDVVADFVFNMTGSYRMNCYIIEDSLTGTGTAWAQRNFFNASASAPYMSLQGAGDPIPGYYHNHVVRKMLGGSWGQSGSIPSIINKGDRFVYSKTIKADERWKMEQVHIIGIVQQWDQDKYKRPIINAVEGDVELLTGTGTTTLVPAFRVYPNPASDLAWVEFGGEIVSNGTIQVLNSLGQEVFNKKLENLTGKQLIPIQLESYQPGIYFVRLITNEKVRIERLIKE